MAMLEALIYGIIVGAVNFENYTLTRISNFVISPYYCHSKLNNEDVTTLCYVVFFRERPDVLWRYDFHGYGDQPS